MKNVDWHDGKLWASIVGLVIVLIQQAMALLGLNYPVDWQGVANIANTIITLLSLVGVVNNVAQVKLKGGRNGKTK